MFWGLTALCLVGLSWLIFGIIMGQAPKAGVAAGPLLFLASLLAFVVSVIAGCLQGIPPVSVARGMTIVILVGSGLANALQLIFMSKAMQRGPNGIIWSMTQSGFIIPFLFGVLCYNAKSSPACWAGFVSVVTALFLIAVSKGGDQKQYQKWRLLAFLAFAVTGISQALSNIPSYYPGARDISSAWKSAAVALGMVLGTILFSPFDEGMTKWFNEVKASFFQKRVWIYCLYLESFEILASFFLLYPGMDRLAKAGVGAIAYPVMVGSCIVGFEVYSIVFLHERRTLLQYLELLFCMLGVVSLAL